MSSPAYARTPFSDADKKWLATHQHAKMLDPGVNVLGVAARQGDMDDHPLTRHLNLPTVIECYPLRVAHDPSKSAKGSGFSAAKWDSKSGEEPVPWPNTFWLVDPTLVAKVGQLEHEGLIVKYNKRLGFKPREMERREREIAAGIAHSKETAKTDPEYDADAARAFARQHEAYGQRRWSLLTEEDKAFATERGFDAVIRDLGVGGLRYKNQVKCLHLHYAHWLASGGG
jgi:hypothetical protein